MNQNQRNCLKAFLSPETRTIKDVAEAAGLTRPTIYAYLSDPAFSAELRQRQDAVIGKATARLARLARKALDGLEDVLDHPSDPGAGNKRLAAKDVLSMLDKFTDKGLEERITALEKVAHQKPEKKQ